MTLHRVWIEDVVHAYRPYGQYTLCGEAKQGEPRAHGHHVTCAACVDTARADAIREADRQLGLKSVSSYPPLTVANVA